MAARYDLDNRGGLSKYQYLHRFIRSDEEVKHLAAEQGISLDMLSDYCAHPSAKSSHCVVVSFASIPTGHAAVAIELLETIFQKEILAHQR